MQHPHTELFSWQARVYYEDTDAGGVVYYANYLTFLERARTEWLRARGLIQSDLLKTHAFVVRQLTIDYRKPARLDDLLRINLSLIRFGQASMTLKQCIECIETGSQPTPDPLLMVSADIKLACISTKDFRPTPWPESIRKLIESAPP